MVKYLTKADRQWIRFLALPYFELKEVEVFVSEDTKEWPDIEVYPRRNPPLIVANQTWAKQLVKERRKRIVHELLHIKGIAHNENIGFSTYPAKDKFSRLVYKDIVANAASISDGKYHWSPRRFGL